MTGEAANAMVTEVTVKTIVSALALMKWLTAVRLAANRPDQRAPVHRVDVRRRVRFVRLRVPAAVAAQAGRVRVDQGIVAAIGVEVDAAAGVAGRVAADEPAQGRVVVAGAIW